MKPNEHSLLSPVDAPEGRPRKILHEVPDLETAYPIRCYIDEGGRAVGEPQLEPELLRRIMTYMILNREVDERLTKLQRQGRVGFHIGSIGEEGIMIGTAAAFSPDDWIVPCYREAGVALYRGLGLQTLVANMFGTAEDWVQGRQMPCHYTDREHNFLSISSPVGTQIVQATGVAWAAKLKRASHAVGVYFGDGATSEGDFHNGLNFAGVYKVPCVFICRNNQWAISTPLTGQTASRTIAQKAIAYGVHAERVDGNDPLAAYQATKDAVRRATSGQGSTLLEMYTYRQGAHSTSDDPRAYREQEEVDAWLTKGPLRRFSRYLSARGIWNEREEEEVKKRVANEVNKAVAIVEKQPRPSIESMFSDVYKHPTWIQREQLEDLRNSLAEGYAPPEH